MIQSHVQLGRQLPLLCQLPLLVSQTHTVDVIHVPKLFGTKLLLILLGATAVDPESHGYRITNVTVRHPHVTKLNWNFQLSVFVVPCHVGQMSLRRASQH